MTRGKAIATVAVSLGCHTEAAAHHVDALVALGILKLDEPKTAEEKANTALIDAGFGVRSRDIIRAAIHKAGLRIVEADGV